MFMTVVLLFPTTLHTTAKDMNYAVVVLGGVVLLSLAYYFLAARRWFRGPSQTAEVVYEVSGKQTSSAEKISSEALESDKL